MSWPIVKLGEILRRKREPVKLVPAQEYKLVTIRLYHNGVELRNTAKGEDIKSSMSIVRAGDFILSGIDARNGAFGIVPNDLDGAIVTNDFWCLDPDSKRLDKEFFLFLTSTSFFDHICKISSDGTTQRIRLQKDKFFNFEIPLPPIPEQRQLVAKLKKTKTLTNILAAELNDQLSTVKKLRQQVLQDAVQGKLVSQDKNDEPASELLKKIKVEKDKLIKDKKIKKEKDLPPIKPDEIPFEIPANWVWCRLGQLSTRSEAGKSFKCQEVPLCGTEWGVVKVSAVSWDEFLEDKNKVYSKLQPEDISAKIEIGDFLISRANTSELVGKSVVVKNITKNLLLSDKTIRFRFSELVSLDFVNICNNSLFSRKYYAAMGTGSSPSMKNITRDHMRNLLIPLPPYCEQIRIVTKVNQLTRMSHALEESIRFSAQQMNSLLSQILTESLESHDGINSILGKTPLEERGV